jgi:ligand-binding sensor domain-containing protein/serine phosphatase RsbU (regulator of sigma subunit)
MSCLDHQYTYKSVYQSIQKRTLISVWLSIQFIFFAFHVGLAQTKQPSLDPHKKLTQYILDHWTTDNGLPANNIRKVFQTKDGYLWMTSFDGVINFDGVRFKVFNKKNQKNAFHTNTTYTLNESSDNALWIGTQGNGLLKYKNGKFENKGLDKYAITALHIESEDRFWVSARNEGVFLYHPKSGVLQHLDYKGFQKASVYAITEDKKGNTWFGSEGNGLTVLNKNKQFNTYNTQQGLPTNSVLEVFADTKGRVWAGTTKGLAYLEDTTFKKVEELENSIIYKMLEDGAGNLWIATSSGLYRKNALSEKYEIYPIQRETPLTNVLDIYLDPEGSLWIATYRNGLFRLKDGKFKNYTYLEGLSTASVGSICELTPHKYLLGMNNGKINVLENNKISIFPIQTPLPEVRVFHITQDTQKNLWISTFNGLLKVSALGVETFYQEKDGFPDNVIRFTYQDKKGNIWVGTRSGGVVCMDMNGQVKKIYNTSNGLSSNFVMSIAEDLQGNLLIATNDGGLNILDAQGNVKVFTFENGLMSNLIFSTYTDAQGVIWIVGDAGITRFEKGQFFHYTSEEGLPNESPFDFVEDRQGNVWLPTSRGVIKVLKKELNDYAQGKIKQIHWLLYDRHDGIKNEDCTGAAHSLLTSQGLVMILTNGGLLEINPPKIPKNHLKPSIRINGLWADGAFLDVHQKIILSPNMRRIVIDYSALSLLASAKVRFKYKLENFDDDWIDAEDEREAIYTNLPSGEYIFRVIACNNDGVWNLKGTSLKITKIPRFYQTLSFISLMILMGIVLTAASFRWRVYHIQRRKRELERLVLQKTAYISEQNTALEIQKDEILAQKKLVEQTHQDITNSIIYAKRIQEAILPTYQDLKTAFSDFFLIYQPRDIVSGDFYWHAHKDGKDMIAVIDCTGHGVPGAFMSMIGNDLLNEIVHLKGITQSHDILEELHIRLTQTLKQRDNFNKDGMDIALCVVDHTHKAVAFSGAKQPLHYIQDFKLCELKGDKLPIGGFLKKNMADESRLFTQHLIQVQEPTYFYMFSDGFQDQFGEFSRKKFGRHKIRQLLLEIHQEPLTKQKQLIMETMAEWKGTERQIDDMLVFGFKL